MRNHLALDQVFARGTRPVAGQYRVETDQSPVLVDPFTERIEILRAGIVGDIVEGSDTN